MLLCELCYCSNLLSSLFQLLIAALLQAHVASELVFLLQYGKTLHH